MAGRFEFRTETFVLQPRDELQVVIETGLANHGIVWVLVRGDGEFVSLDA